VSEDILINRIDVQFNDKAIDADFYFLKINSDLKGKQNYGKVINAIYKHVQPLSLCSLGKGRYAVLMKKGNNHTLGNLHYTVLAQKSCEMATSSKVKLLIGALPTLTTDHQQSSEGVGLYYLSDIERIRNVDVLRSYEVKIEWEQAKHLVLRIEAATFTPVSYHTNADGQLYGDCTHLPRIKFDPWTQELTRNPGGEYIKKKHRDRNMRSEMVSLDTKNPAKFWRSKMGVQAIFMDDVKRYLSDYMSLRFKILSPEYRVRFKDRDVKASYESINRLLSSRSINLINLTNSNTSVLVTALEQDGLAVTESKHVASDALNLAIHHNKDFYEAKQQADPYKSLRTEKDIVIQSAYPETLIRKGKLSQSEYEACKKELFVKWETASREFKLVKPGGDWLFVVCHAPKDEERYYNTLSWCNGKLSFERLDEGNAQDRFLLDLPRLLKNHEHAVVDLNSGEPFIFEDTNYVALPKYQDLAVVMNELSDGYASGLKSVWIEEFLSLLESGEINVTNPALVKCRLKKLLLRNPLASTLYKKDIFNDKDNKITYRGGLQTFFDWVATEKGLRLGASLKSQETGYIEASLGLFYNNEERLYFVGDKDNVKTVPRFCKIRRILTDAENVPTELLQMMEVFHIRHKQATIYPFPFKHLREMAKVANWAVAPTRSDPV